MFIINLKDRFQVIKNKQKGAGMVETLVSMLILGVGLLGVLSLQVNGATSNQRAIFITEAQVLAQDMADRLRSFGSDGLGARAQAINDIYKATDTLTNNYASQACDTEECTPTETAQMDQHEWEDAIDDSSLPSGSGKIILRNDNLNQYIVRVFWDQDRTGASTPIGDDENCFGNPNQIDKQANLTCYDAVVTLYRD